MTLPYTRVTTAIAALVTLGLAACADSPGPTGVIRSSDDLALANGNASVRTALATVGWQEETRRLVTAGSISPIVAARMYALVGVAQYGAVVDADANVEEGGSPAGVAGVPDLGRIRFEARRGAVAGASQWVLSSLFPSAATVITQRLRDEEAASPPGMRSYFTSGVTIGKAWGVRMLARADGFTTVFVPDYPLPNTGFWVTNPGVAPAGPQFSIMTPYFLTRADQFRPLPPPAIGSAAFNTDLAEVSSFVFNRTPEQLTAAVTLNLSNGTHTSLGYWDVLAAQYIAERNFDERAAAHVFALTNAATMDAVIGCWDAKYYYFTMRPWQANPALAAATTPPALPLLPIGRPNHPSYPSGHSCVSASAATVLKAFFPEHTDFLDAQVTAAGMSRIYAGIHYRFDITAGQALGREVAAAALAYDQTRGLLAAVR